MTHNREGDPWPLAKKDATEWVKTVEEIVFSPLLRSTLVEWAQLKQRCRMKSLSRRHVARADALLGKCGDGASFSAAFEQLPPGPAYALLCALQLVLQTSDGWQVLIEHYRGKKDFEDRVVCIFCQRSLSWLDKQQWPFEVDEYLGLNDS